MGWVLAGLCGIKSTWKGRAEMQIRTHAHMFWVWVVDGKYEWADVLNRSLGLGRSKNQLDVKSNFPREREREKQRHGKISNFAFMKMFRFYYVE